jgi:DNA-binding XRE family transcriptional regulator
MMAEAEMTPDEIKSARATFDLTQEEFAKAFLVSKRAVGGWETGHRNGKPHAVPEPVACLIKLALKYDNVRRELGIAEHNTP